MSELSDRERLQKLAHEKEQLRQSEAEKQKLRQIEEAKTKMELVANDHAKTIEVLKHCKEIFEGFKLVPTGHEVSVDTANCSVLHGIKSDGVDYVCLHITHWSDETGNFQGQIPILLARFRHGEYQVVDVEGKKYQAKTFDDLKQSLIHSLSEMGRDVMRKLFTNVRTHWGQS